MKCSHPQQRFARHALVTLAAVALLVSCGSDDDGASGSTDAAAATDAPTDAPTDTDAPAGTDASSDTSAAEGDVCASRDALTESINSLTDVDLSSGVEGIQASVDDVRTNLTTLRETAGDELRSEIQAVEDALTDLQTALGNLGSGGLADAGTALTDFATSGEALISSLTERCG